MPGGDKCHTWTLARAVVSTFDACIEIHAAHRLVMNSDYVAERIDSINTYDNATSADITMRSILHKVCTRLLHAGFKSPVVIAALECACFPKACKEFPVVWTGTVCRLAGVAGELCGECMFFGLVVLDFDYRTTELAIWTL